MFNDEINLENAECYADSAKGVYIPQYFAETIHRHLVEGVSNEDWEILEAGPYHEYYWDAWNDVTNNCRIKHPSGREYCLWQDGDLWLLPVS